MTATTVEPLYGCDHCDFQSSDPEDFASLGGDRVIGITPCAYPATCNDCYEAEMEKWMPRRRKPAPAPAVGTEPTEPRAAVPFWVVRDYDGNALPGRWGTESAAVAQGLLGRYLLSGLDVAEVTIDTLRDADWDPAVAAAYGLTDADLDIVRTSTVGA